MEVIYVTITYVGLIGQLLKIEFKLWHSSLNYELPIPSSGTVTFGDILQLLQSKLLSNIYTYIRASGKYCNLKRRIRLTEIFVTLVRL